jgi:hypothetical protein
MELAGLESKETQYDCYPMTLLFSLEKDYHLAFIKMTKNRHKNCLSILFVVLFQLHDLLMQFFSSFLSKKRIYVIRVCAQSNRFSGGYQGKPVDISAHSSTEHEGLNIFVTVFHDLFDF